MSADTADLAAELNDELAPFFEAAVGLRAKALEAGIVPNGADGMAWEYFRTAMAVYRKARGMQEVPPVVLSCQTHERG